MLLLNAGVGKADKSPLLIPNRIQPVKAKLPRIKSKLVVIPESLSRFFGVFDNLTTKLVLGNLRE
jgi:hypothetical protein